jgi:ubiquinol-cytochrome c reductase cytochrome c1 subunit
MPISASLKKLPALLLALALGWGAACLTRAVAADETPSDADWQSWTADANVTDVASLQRGARDFAGYCLGCHSLKYERWSRPQRPRPATSSPR